MTEYNSNGIYWFVFVQGQLLLEIKDGQLEIPFHQQVPTEVSEHTYFQELPDIDDKKCLAYAANTADIDNERFILMGLRKSYDHIPERFYLQAGKASELLYWDSCTRFCGSCGAPMERTGTISKKCTKCGKEVWPHVSPAIIVRVRKRGDDGDRILMVHAINFKGTFFGLVAGFVETGETLEECVRREVMEETGLTIKNIKYFGSQPWPYPSGIMIAFTADYESGELRLQKEELNKGGWFTRENVPELSGKMSIGRKLIDDWLSGNADK